MDCVKAFDTIEESLEFIEREARQLLFLLQDLRQEASTSGSSQLLPCVVAARGASRHACVLAYGRQSEPAAEERHEQLCISFPPTFFSPSPAASAEADEEHGSTNRVNGR